MESSEAQQTSLYNGVSSRSRGWKTWKPQNIPRSRLANPPTVMRWDGASRSSEIWDSLRRDPELWFRDGDCYVHLHGEGLSRRGAAFRVPYSVLLEAKLINNFVSRTRTDTASCLQNPKRRQIELFIPAPPKSDKRHSYNYHLATRNLFAFVFRRSMVGECLGGALIALYNSLHQFRTPDADNLQDLMSYMDEEGYLDFNNQPTYALAILHLAETFQLRGLYIDAFAHCCGMSDRIFLIPEYQLLSSATRILIRRARREMYSRLGKVSTMLKTFLRDELCEIDIELAQKHLERFRALLQQVYTAHFGYYPPPSTNAQTTIFEANCFRAMRNDFEALCEFLEDESFDVFQNNDSLTESHTLTLRSIKSFDTQYGHETLFHPLPLLPDIPRRKPSFWKLAWRNRPTRAGQLRRAQTDTVAALARATNSKRPEVVGNHLVAAYRKFEEDQITSSVKVEKQENPGPVDGRKIRWILIYAIYQTLRRATEVALEIRDATGAPYHLCTSTVDLPPWEGVESVHPLVNARLDSLSLSPSPFSPPALEAISDHDYAELAEQAPVGTRERPRSSVLEHSKSRGTLALQRSFSLRPRSEALETLRQAGARENGNKTNTVAKNNELAADISSMDLAHPPDNKLVDSSASSSSHYSNEAKSSDTPDTSLTSSPVYSAIDKWDNELASVCMRCGLHEIECDPVRLGDDNPSTLLKKRDPRHGLEPAPLHIRKARKRPTSALNIQMPSPQAPTAWDYIQAVMEVQANNYELAGWDQFTHLTDFIEVGSEAPIARPTIF
ncbi:hypothetical protein F5X98DRAFT_208018 [Xylaria grammica]|nr:hypothetical protein F5X98DRAFT_208018 [Xylaria grammica]